VDFIEICNVYVGKMVIKATTRIFNSVKICRSYSDLNFGVTFFGTQCICIIYFLRLPHKFVHHITGELLTMQIDIFWLRDSQVNTAKEGIPHKTHESDLAVSPRNKSSSKPV